MKMNRACLAAAVSVALFVCAALPPSANAEEDFEKWEAGLKQREQSLKLKDRAVELDRREVRIEQKRKDIKEGRWMEEERRGADRDHHGREGRRGEGKGYWGRSRWCPFIGWCGLLIYLGVIHLLLSTIVYRDIRTAQPPMSGMWVVVVLMGGLPATVAYAIFRLMMIKSSGK